MKKIITLAILIFCSAFLINKAEAKNSAIKMTINSKTVASKSKNLKPVSQFKLSKKKITAQLCGVSIYLYDGDTCVGVLSLAYWCDSGVIDWNESFLIM